MKNRSLLAMSLLLVLTLLACRIFDQARSPETAIPPTLEQIPTLVEAPPLTPGQDPNLAEIPTLTPVQIPTLDKVSPTLEPDLDPGAPPPPSSEPPPSKPPPAAAPPPQSQAAEIRPPELREELTVLSNLIGYRVLDPSGTEMGTASDYIVNTCETYIIHFLVHPDPSLNPKPGTFRMLPFDVVTINSGALDAQAQAIEVHLTPEQLMASPVFPDGMNPAPTDWETGLRDYWSQYFRISNLTLGCNVSAAGQGGGTITVYKVAYGTQLLDSGLFDGLGNPLGGVEEAILEPESGKLAFYVVDLSDGSGLVLVPLHATNIPDEALLPENPLSLVLLFENEILLDAPRLASLEDATNASVQQKAREYWRR